MKIHIYWRRKIDNGGETHSCIRVHRLKREWILKEINYAEYKYMNMCPTPKIVDLPPPLILESKN